MVTTHSSLHKELKARRHSALKQQFWRSEFKPLHGLILACVLCIVGFVGATLYSAHGDWEMLQQRVLGSVELSSGQYSARSVEEVNKLSWGNGLDILAELDTMNDALKALKAYHAHEHSQTAESTGQQSLPQLTLAATESKERLDKLLADRTQVQLAAERLHVKSLFSPEYEEYLTQSLTTLTQLTAAQTTATHLVQGN